jgi:predicted DNA-binding ribbon-helix-helix protein
MTSTVIKRSVRIGGRHTSLSLEDAFWARLKEIAASRRTTLRDLITSIDSGREGGNLSSAIRLFVLKSYQQQPNDNKAEDLKNSLVPEQGRSNDRGGRTS